MSWIEHHRVSERLASEAQAALRNGHSEQARVLYARAADAEHDAVSDLDGAKTRTFAISWVSMASLYYKAGMVERAEQVAWRGLNLYSLPDFAKRQLRNLLQSICNLILRTLPIPAYSIVRPAAEIEDPGDQPRIDISRYVEQLDTNIFKKEAIILSAFTSKNIALDSHVQMHESILPRILSDSIIQRLFIGPRRIKIDPAPAAETTAGRVCGDTRGIATMT